jgi:hypothetical protein
MPRAALEPVRSERWVKRFSPASKVRECYAQGMRLPTALVPTQIPVSPAHTRRQPLFCTWIAGVLLASTLVLSGCNSAPGSSGPPGGDSGERGAGGGEGSATDVEQGLSDPGGSETAEDTAIPPGTIARDGAPTSGAADSEDLDPNGNDAKAPTSSAEANDPQGTNPRDSGEDPNLPAPGATSGEPNNPVACHDPLMFEDGVMEDIVQLVLLGAVYYPADAVVDLDPVPANDAASLTQIQMSLEPDLASFRGLECLPALESLELLRVDDPLSVSDLSPLGELTTLQTLKLPQSKIDDLSPLSRLGHLRNLGLDVPDSTDLTPLAALTELTVLNLTTSASDIAPLADLTSLTTLSLTALAIDVTPLAVLTNLQGISLHGVRELTDLSPLSNLKQLEHVLVEGTGLTDLTPFTQLPSLDRLRLNDTLVDCEEQSENLELLAAASVTVQGDCTIPCDEETLAWLEEQRAMGASVRADCEE